MLITYPTQDDPDVQRKLQRLFELYQYSRGLKNEGLQPEYVSRLHPFEHQEILKRLVTVWKRFLVVNATGTGKACLMIKAYEYLQKINDGKYPKRMIVLFQGPLTVSDYKHQIAWVCAKGKYAIPDMSKRQISANIAEKYLVTTYRKFAEEIESPDAHDNYKDCMFVFEEVHNLRNLTKDTATNNAIYSRLHSFIHQVEGAIVTCVTASPMINETREIAPIMNLLLPLDRQLPVGWNYDLVTKEQLEPFMRGLITYVPEIRTVKEIELGEKIKTTFKIKVPIKGEPIVAGNRQQMPETETIEYQSTANLYVVDLKGLQKEVYLNEKRRLGADFTKNFMVIPTTVSLMVFPDGTYSSDPKKGLGKYVSNPQGDVYIPKPEFLKDLRENMWQYSAKYHHIIESELNASNTVTVAGKTITLPGPSLAFVISPRVNGPGAISLAMGFEAFGFERYDSNFSPFVDPQAQECGYPGRAIKIPKKKRYVLLAGDVSNKIDNLRTLFNSPENMFGEYVQVIIASEVAKEGINIYNTLRAYSVTQSWHHAGEYQFFSRILRATSQTSLYNEIIKRLVFAGLDYPQLQGYQLEVLIKKLVSRIDGVSLEAETYMNFVEEKRYNTNRVFQIMKELAYDRYLVGIDGDEILPMKMLEYNNFFLSDQFEEAKELIYEKLAGVYRVYEKGFTLMEAIKYLHNMKLSIYLLRPSIIAAALGWIVKSEKLLLNGSGIEVFTKIDKENINRYIPVRLWIKEHRVDRGIIWYNRNLSFEKLTVDNSIDNILWRERERRVNDAIENLVDFLEKEYEKYNRRTGGTVFQELHLAQVHWFEKLSRNYQSFLIRWVFAEDGYFWGSGAQGSGELKKSERTRSSDLFISEKEFSEIIFDIVRDRYVFLLREPVTNINLISRALGEPSTSRGRKSFEDSDVKMKQVKLIEEEETNPLAQEVFIDISRYAGTVIKKDDDIRVISYDTKRWRKLEPYEIYGYKNIVEMRFKQKYIEISSRAERETGLIWGIKKLDGKFLIMSERVTSKSSVVDEDQRFVSKGINCDSKSKKELIDIYKILGGELDLEKNELCVMIEEQMRRKNVLAET